MKRLMLAIAAGAGLLALSACDEPQPAPVETAPPPMETEPLPPPVETPPPAATPAPPVDGATLPPDQRQSEETVKPESETLFY